MARRLTLSWLKPPQMPDDGMMSLGDHLRELRYRILVMAVVVVLVSALSAIFHRQLYAFLMRPWQVAVADLAISHPHLNTTAVISGVTEPFTLILKICVVGGVVASSPVWLYQIWAYIVPALLTREKKIALMFLGVAVPLFLSGVALGYYILPKGISVMLAFTPDAVPVLNLLDINTFLDFMLRLMLVFGIAFLLPVFVVGLNFAGVLKSDVLSKSRNIFIFCIFVFGAAATPSTDPFSMVALAIPMCLLFLAAEVICRVNDKRRQKRPGSEMDIVL